MRRSTAAQNRHPQLNEISTNNLIRHSTKPVTVADVSLPCLTLTSKNGGFSVYGVVIKRLRNNKV